MRKMYFCRLIIIPNVIMQLTLLILSSRISHAYDFDITFKNAYPTIQELSNKQDKTGEDYLKLGWAYYGFKNNIDEAIKSFEKSIEINPELFEAHYLLGLINKSRGNQDKAIDFWLKCLDFDRPENALIVHDILKFDLSQMQVNAIIHKYEILLEKTQNHLLKAHILYCLAGEYGVLGMPDKAEATYKKIGLISQWKIIGPFNNNERTGFDTAYPPEQEIVYDKPYQGVAVDVRWRDLFGVELTETVDFNSMFYPNEWVVGYALTYVYSDKEQKVAIRLGSDDAAKVWVNDNLVIQNPLYQVFILDQYAVGAMLHKGWNKILVKVCEGSGDWRFGLRITGPEGQPLPDLKFTTDQQNYKSDRGATVSLKEDSVTSIQSILQKQMQNHPADYLKVYIFAEWLRLLDLKKEALAEFEHLVAAERQSAIFRYGLANIELASDKNEKALADFKETLVEDTGHVEALIEVADYFYKQKMYEQALSYIEKARSITQDCIDSYYLSSLIYMEKNWKKDAYDEAMRGLQRYPESTQMLYYAAMSSEKFYHISEALQYFQKIMSLNKWLKPNDYYDLLYYYIIREDYDNALAIFEAKKPYYKLDVSYYCGLISFEISAGRYDDAITQCDKALGIAPDNAELMRYKGEAYYCKDLTEEAVKCWEKAVQIDPRLTSLRERIEKSKGGGESILLRYALSNAQVKEILDTNDASETYRIANAIILLDKEIYNINDDASYEVLVHEIIEITDNKGIEDFKTVKLPSRDIIVEKAVVKNPWETDTDITEIDFDSGYMYPPNLRKGSIIEYKLRYYISTGLVKGYFFDYGLFKTRFPIYRKELIIAMPQQRELRVFKRGDEIAYRTEEFLNKKIHIWEIKKTDGIKEELYLPDFKELFPYVCVSDIPSWDYLAHWENNLIDDQLEIDLEIQAALDKILFDKTTQEEKIIAIYNYLCRVMHYVSLEHPVYGWKPNRATKIFKDKYGDCKDTSILMIAMLKAVGVDSYLALISTKPYNFMIEEIPIPIANHAIVYIPQAGEKKDLFLDVAAGVVNYGSLPPADEGIKAMVLTRPGYKIINTPQSTAADNYYYAKLDMKIIDAKKMKFDVEENYYGTLAGEMRYFIGSDKFDGWIKSKFNIFAPGVESSEHVVSHAMDMDRPLTIYAEFTSQEIFKALSEKRYEMYPVCKFELTKRYAIDEKREYDVNFQYARSGIVEENLILPEGTEVISMPEDKKVESDLITYERTYKLENGILKSIRKHSFKTAIIIKADFARFNKLLSEIDGLEQQGVILRDSKDML